jgi:hypothetical protein
MTASLNVVAVPAGISFSTNKFAVKEHDEGT